MSTSPNTPSASGTVEADHGMRPIAVAFALGNAAVLAVLAAVIVTGHLDASGAMELAVSTATAAPTQ